MQFPLEDPPQYPSPINKSHAIQASNASSKADLALLKVGAIGGISSDVSIWTKTRLDNHRLFKLK